MNTTVTSSSGPAASSKGEAPDVVFEINLVDGAKAERLGLQQAAVIRDILRWYRRNGTSASPAASVT
jgi:hypothetical protein